MSLLKRITTMLALLMPALAFSREILQVRSSLLIAGSCVVVYPIVCWAGLVALHYNPKECLARSNISEENCFH